MSRPEELTTRQRRILNGDGAGAPVPAEYRLGDRLPGRTYENTADAYTLEEDVEYLLMNPANAVGPTIQLPKISSYNSKRLVIKDRKGNAASLPIVVTAATGETIDGASTLTIDANYASVNLVPHGLEWSQT